MLPVRVMGPRDPRCLGTINTTSHGGWTRDLSPFLLGPVMLCRGIVSFNMENAWQYLKVYPGQVDVEGNPTNDWKRWAWRGWHRTQADRYPMGKGARPLYSWWDGEHLDYIDARKRIYIPLYAEAVQHTAGFERLRQMYRAGEQLNLWDFDGYDHRALGVTLDEVVNNPDKKMGHAFVLAMLLEEHPLVRPLLRLRSNPTLSIANDDSFPKGL